MSDLIHLRAWQKAAFELFDRSTSPDFLAVATPGAGKTTFALTCARAFLARAVAARAATAAAGASRAHVVVVAPTVVVVVVPAAAPPATLASLQELVLPAVAGAAPDSAANQCSAPNTTPNNDSAKPSTSSIEATEKPRR